ncbi:hypothetical protein VP01_1077g4 [Puccinia sorghi]|uniref:Uncharacterized protein n=1 Tax=Puccinia sorghi TaxID=27349 RepID=A0A0L6VTH0_9BASI|nr:hypothetical protein VP01_1077g4 [Puccinia sorghi]
MSSAEATAETRSHPLANISSTALTLTEQGQKKCHFTLTLHHFVAKNSHYKINVWVPTGGNNETDFKGLKTGMCENKEMTRGHIYMAFKEFPLFVLHKYLYHMLYPSVVLFPINFLSFTPYSFPFTYHIIFCLSIIINKQQIIQDCWPNQTSLIQYQSLVVLSESTNICEITVCIEKHLLGLQLQEICNGSEAGKDESQCGKTLIFVLHFCLICCNEWIASNRSWKCDPYRLKVQPTGLCHNARRGSHLQNPHHEGAQVKLKIWIILHQFSQGLFFLDSKTMHFGNLKFYSHTFISLKQNLPSYFRLNVMNLPFWGVSWLFLYFLLGFLHQLILGSLYRIFFIPPKKLPYLFCSGGKSIAIYLSMNFQNLFKNLKTLQKKSKRITRPPKKHDVGNEFIIIEKNQFDSKKLMKNNSNFQRFDQQPTLVAQWATLSICMGCISKTPRQHTANFDQRLVTENRLIHVLGIGPGLY